MNNVQVHILQDHYKTTLKTDNHLLIADEPISEGGTDLGFTPDELLLSALGACTAITLRMYADRKGWQLTDVKVNLNIERNKEKQTTAMTREIQLIGNLSEEERKRLLQIANACPVHKTLTNPIEITTTVVLD
jgi:putative redox protein